MANHTPDEWLINCTSADIEQNLGYYQINSTEGETIALVKIREDNLEVGEANLVLIQSSPDLLEACKEAIRMYESVQPAGGWQGVYEQLLEAVNSASYGSCI